LLFANVNVSRDVGK